MSTHRTSAELPTIDVLDEDPITRLNRARADFHRSIEQDVRKLERLVIEMTRVAMSKGVSAHATRVASAFTAAGRTDLLIAAINDEERAA